MGYFDKVRSLPLTIMMETIVLWKHCELGRSTEAESEQFNYLSIAG